eukprot:Nk52_evm9s322 gene=Nk52_evmTU9s322
MRESSINGITEEREDQQEEEEEEEEEEVTLYIKGFRSLDHDRESFDTWRHCHNALCLLKRWRGAALGYSWKNTYTYDQQEQQEQQHEGEEKKGTHREERPLSSTVGRNSNNTSNSDYYYKSLMIPIQYGKYIVPLVTNRVFFPVASLLTIEMAAYVAQLYSEFSYALRITSQLEDKNVVNLAGVLRELRDTYPRVRVVAHSLGCRYLLAALSTIPPNERPDEVHLCAPAVTVAEFAGVVERYGEKEAVPKRGRKGRVSVGFGKADQSCKSSVVTGAVEEGEGTSTNKNSIKKKDRLVVPKSHAKRGLEYTDFYDEEDCFEVATPTALRKNSSYPMNANSQHSRADVQRPLSATGEEDKGAQIFAKGGNTQGNDIESSSPSYGRSKLARDRMFIYYSRNDYVLGFMSTVLDLKNSPILGVDASSLEGNASRPEGGMTGDKSKLKSSSKLENDKVTHNYGLKSFVYEDVESVDVTDVFGMLVHTEYETVFHQMAKS